MDTVSTEHRSRIMARIRSTDTGPEILVRKLSHALGARFRLHRLDLPGKPDLVFPSRRLVIFVHGCFWHQHRSSKCQRNHKPKSRPEYWNNKLNRNIRRDRLNKAKLLKLGWRVIVVWECETKNLGRLSGRLKSLLLG